MCAREEGGMEKDLVCGFDVCIGDVRGVLLCESVVLHALSDAITL